MASKVLKSIPGEVVTLQATTLAMEPDLKGTCIRDKQLPFVFRSADGNILLQGTVQDRIVRSKKTGFLHFYNLIRNMPGGRRSIIEVVRSNFSMTVTVGWRYDGLGTVQPLKARRAGENVARIRFEFTPGGPYNGLPSGKNSRFFYLKTEFTDYNTDGETILMLNSGEMTTIQTGQPIF